MNRHRHFLIVEPPCIQHRQNRLRQRLLDTLKDAGQTFEHWLTSGDMESDISKLRQYQQRITDVVVLGGDGSLSLVANAFAFTEVAVGILPCGSGNDFARHCYPAGSDPVEIVTSSHCQQIDLGRCNQRYFINVASVGLSEAVVAQQSAQCQPGSKRYWLSALNQIFNYRARSLRLHSKERHLSGSMLMVAFANGRFFGGGIPIAPNARLDDGCLDVCRIGACPVLPRLYYMVKVLTGRHLSSKTTDYWQTRSVHLDTPGLSIEADGDIIGITPATIEICPKALWLKVPCGRRF